MRIVFARTRYEYDSYTDFWQLVRLSGFDICHVDEVDLASDSIYIVTPINGEFRPHVDHRRKLLEEDGRPKRATIVWWNLERPDSGGPTLREVVDDLSRYVDVSWVSDRHYASLDTRLRHVVLGSHPGLRMHEGRLPTQYDFTHQSYSWGRREGIYPALMWGGGLREGPNGWGEARDQVLRSSKLMLNVHQTPALISEPVRFALTAAYSLPMVSETLVDPFPLVRGEDYIEADYASLVDVVKASAAADNTRYGESLHKRLCSEWPFRRGVEEAVERIFQQ